MNRKILLASGTSRKSYISIISTVGTNDIPGICKLKQRERYIRRQFARNTSKQVFCLTALPVCTKVRREEKKSKSVIFYLTVKVLLEISHR